MKIYCRIFQNYLFNQNIKIVGQFFGKNYKIRVQSKY